MVINNTEVSSDLRYVLEKLATLHGSLVELLRAEYAHMSAVDVKALSEAAKSKEVLLEEIWRHEQLRIDVTAKLALKLGMSPESVSLANIIERLPANESSKMQLLRDSLNLLVTGAKELNAKNMEFAESSLAHIEEMKRNVLGVSSGSSKENYSNSGLKQPVPEQGGRLLSTEA